MRLTWRVCSLFALASCAAIRRRSPCRDLYKIPRGGADKKHVKKLDPRGTPLAARAARPLVALAERYDAAIQANPKLELWIQIGGTILVLQTIKALVARYGDHRYATLVARALYLGFLLAHQAMLSAVKARVEAENDTTPLSLPGNPLLALVPVPTSCIITQPSARRSIASQGSQSLQGSQDGASALLKSLLGRETTIRDYDLDMVRKGRHSQLGSILAMAYFHLKRGYLQPLVLQTVMGFVSLAKDPLVQIHLFGRTAEGLLSRPFKPPVPAWMKALQDKQQTSARVESIEVASAVEDEEEDEEDVEDDEDDASFDDDDDASFDDEDENESSDADDLDDEYDEDNFEEEIDEDDVE